MKKTKRWVNIADALLDIKESDDVPDRFAAGTLAHKKNGHVNPLVFLASNHYNMDVDRFLQLDYCDQVTRLAKRLRVPFDELNNVIDCYDGQLERTSVRQCHNAIDTMVSSINELIAD